MAKLESKGKINRLSRALFKLSLKIRKRSSSRTSSLPASVEDKSPCELEHSDVRNGDSHMLSDVDSPVFESPLGFSSTPQTLTGYSPDCHNSECHHLSLIDDGATPDGISSHSQVEKAQNWQRTSIGSLLIRHNSSFSAQISSAEMIPFSTLESPEWADSRSNSDLLDSPLLDCILEEEGASPATSPEVLSSPKKECSNAHRRVSVAGYLPEAVTKPAKLEPIEQVKRDVAELDSGDTVFTICLNQLYSKLLIALNEPNSAYLFRDYAGNFTTLLDRFGPGGYDSHRAPSNLAWMIKLILPWLSVNSSPDEGALAIFEEVNGWCCNIARYLGTRCSDVILDGGVWDCCIESMTSSIPIASNIAYETARTIVSTLPLTKELVFKVVMIRMDASGYECADVVITRNHQLRLIRRVIERMHNMKNRQNLEEFMFYLEKILGELERWTQIECNVRIQEKIDEIKAYASRVYHSLIALAKGYFPLVGHCNTFSDECPPPTMSLELGRSSSFTALHSEPAPEHFNEYASTLNSRRGFAHLAKRIINTFKARALTYRDRNPIYELNGDSQRSGQNYLSVRRRTSAATICVTPIVELEPEVFENGVSRSDSLSATF